MPYEETEHNSGIYVRRKVKVSGTDIGPTFLKSWASDLREAFDGWLDAVESEATAVMSAGETPPSDCRSERQEKRWFEVLANRKTSAKKLLAKCALLRHHISSGSTERAAFVAFHIGRQLEVMYVAGHEHDAARGAKSTRDASRGSRKVHGSPEERQTQYDDWQQAITRKIAQNPRLSLTEARRLVANDVGKCATTVRRHTRKPTDQEIEAKQKVQK